MTQNLLIMPLITVYTVQEHATYVLRLTSLYKLCQCEVIRADDYI